MKLIKFSSITILMIVFILGHMIQSCTKIKEETPQPYKVYWGNAIYNYGKIIRDSSTYQSYPYTITPTDDICLIPRTNDFKSADLMVVGDTCDFSPIATINGICYLNDITSKVKGTFVSTRLLRICACKWNNKALTEGTIKLNQDNSIDVEYTDSLLTTVNDINHYKIHFSK